tara:strand:- start:54953 stop:55216 length:264 start_codon:yes stop_codon:yes gene_type:complete
MTSHFATSNLSKISTKFRTSGNISQPRRKAGSSLNEIGISNKETIKCTTPDEYLARLHYAFDYTEDKKLKQFLYSEIRKLHIQRGTW